MAERDFYKFGSQKDNILADQFIESSELPSCIFSASSAIAIGMAGMVLLKSTYRKKNICFVSILFFFVVLDYLLSIAGSDEIMPTVISLFDTFIETFIMLVVGILFWQKSEYDLAQKFGQYQVGISIASLLLFITAIAGYPEYCFTYGGVLDILNIFSLCFIGFISWRCSRSFKKSFKNMCR